MPTWTSIFRTRFLKVYHRQFFKSTVFDQLSNTRVEAVCADQRGQHHLLVERTLNISKDPTQGMEFALIFFFFFFFLLLKTRGVKIKFYFYHFQCEWIANYRGLPQAIATPQTMMTMRKTFPYGALGEWKIFWKYQCNSGECTVFCVLICTHTTLQFFLLQISRHEEHASQLIGTGWNAVVPYWGHPLE
jgi:hypothetical protein